MSKQNLHIDEIGTVGERINELVDLFCKGNKTAFGRAANIQSGVLAGIVGSRSSKPGFEILQKLLTAYPSVNPTWLLFGRGQMLQDSNVEAVSVPTPAQIDELVRYLVDNELKKIRKEQFPYLASQEKRIADGILSSMETLQLFRSQEAHISAAMLGQDEEAEARKRLKDDEKMQMEIIDNLKREAISIQESRVRMHEETKNILYRLDAKADASKPFGGLLAHRLGISDESALMVVKDKLIRSVYIEGEGYRVSEQAVREFLGEA